MDTMSAPAPSLLSPDQQELWARVNDTATDVPAGSVPALVVEHARTAADAVAVVAPARMLRYGELVAAAGALAGRLRELGAGPDRPVAVSVEPGWEQVVAVLAAGLAGAAFQPVPPDLPQPARWRRLADAGAAAVLTQSWLAERLDWPDGAALIALDTELDAGPDAGPVGPAVPPAGDEQPGCLLDVDGDQVTLAQAGLVNTMTGAVRRFDLSATDRLLLLSPLDDELGVAGILTALAAGAALVVPEDIDLRTPAAWVTLMDREAVTVWLSPPALATLFAEHLQLRGEGVPDRLRIMLLAGEPLTAALVARLRALAGRPLRIGYLGGAAPAGIWSCGLQVGELDGRAKHLPIGTPLPNQRVYVLSETLAPCPVWVTGRVHYGGRGLAAGDRTDVVRLPGTDERLYRSDQLGRLLPDGTIEVVGTDATRVTVNGHPLNLRDVEGGLATHEAVLAAAVVPGGEGSVGYVKLAAGGRATGAELLDHLRGKMSPYLLPDRIEPVGVLPLTPGGRVDRAALTAAAAATAAAEAEPVTATVAARPDERTEQACALAARILGVSDVEPTMNLLDLGATSVQLVRLAVQAEQELGIQVDVEELLRFPSVTVLVSFTAPGTATTAVGGEPPADAAAAPSELILDPVARMAFKDRQPAIRRDLDSRPGVELSRPTGDRDRLVRRASRRAFDPEPVPVEALARLLGVLRQFRSGVEPKYAYPSAGGLYPLQVYVGVAAGRVDGVAAGLYYYHPVRHRLADVAPDVVDPAAHAWINRDLVRASAFAIYLVAALDAMVPMYGDRARDYCLLEAGGVAQLLQTEATELGLGLCQIGELDTAALVEPLGLGEQRELIHTLVGGGAVPAGGGDGEADAAAGMLARARQVALPDGTVP